MTAESSNNPNEPKSEISQIAVVPAVFIRDGQVFASSRDVAVIFEKRHDNVMRDIRSLIEASGGSLKFEETSYVDDQNGQTYRSYDMSRDAFTVLAMGFTGKRALDFKLAYIEQFNVMEAKLRTFDPAVALSDPAQLRSLLLVHIDREMELQGQVEEMRPQVQALERIAISDGSLCITDAAKTLQVQPKALFSFLRSHRWIYTRQGCSEYIAYQDKLASGLLEHKTTTVTKSDGYEKTVTQVRVTPKGLTRLAREFPPVAQAA